VNDVVGSVAFNDSVDECNSLSTLLVEVTEALLLMLIMVVLLLLLSLSLLLLLLLFEEVEDTEGIREEFVELGIGFCDVELLTTPLLLPVEDDDVVGVGDVVPDNCEFVVDVVEVVMPTNFTF
jgi:hypothetical protein